ncbi:hypothetical protein DR64_1347 [Paraburkholderia xenovorans LB400]|jgi:hypothetical protein|nr:hypothetical protein [Paraburkholderia xenovorans]AIP31533.1 hypothetical protein DR64_1347 [Paraburkholderia xenovorans LB400]
MGTASNVPPGTNSNADDRRTERARRRYDRLAARYLPAWAPDPLVLRFHERLQDLAFARFERRAWGGNESSSKESWYAAALERTARLSTYHADMRSVWETLKTTPANPGYNISRDGDKNISLLLLMLDGIVGRFHSAPKLPPAARKRSLARVVEAGTKLLEAIEAAPETRSIFRSALGDYIGQLYLAEREASAEQEIPGYGWFLMLSDRQPTYLREPGQDANASWSSWTAAERNVWMLDTVAELSLTEPLRLALQRVEQLRQRAPAVAQPGRQDSGLLPFLVRELSATMRMIYGRPLHNAVALLVSAIANLQNPLSRDDIRPYLRQTRKASQR